MATTKKAPAAKTARAKKPAASATAKLTKASAVPAAPAKPAPALPAPVKAKAKAVTKPVAQSALQLAKPAPKAPAKPKADKASKEKKPKLVRDSFTIPKAEYLVLEALKARAGKLAHPVKKSELLRAGIKALAAMADAEYVKALSAVPAIKTGRPTGTV